MNDKPKLEILDCEQGTPEWFQARCGVITASRFKDVLSKGKGVTRDKYMYQLAGEIITGEPMSTYSNAHMERGHEREEEARKMYVFMCGVDGQDVVETGFMRQGDIGCSPDGLVGDDGMIEIKDALPHIQAERLDRGTMPTMHTAQVQGQLMVSGRDWCDFMSHCRGMKPLIIRVKRDEIYIANLKRELVTFSNDLQNLVERIK